MLENILTEHSNPASANIDQLPTEEMLRVINREDQLIAHAVAAEIPQIARAVDGIVAAMERGGHLFYLGAGTSGRLGVLDASECPPTYNVPYELVQGIMAGGESALSRATEASEDDPTTGVRDLQARGFTAGDVVCGIAASGRTPYVLGAIEYANSIGALTLGICCVPDSPLSRVAKVTMAPVTGPEVVTGSTRMKAGTATKLVLNMLSTGAMIRLGYTYGNQMVNVQPKNEKLVDRAQRIVASIAGVGREEAARLLEESGRSVRVAIVMSRLKLSRQQAEARLAASGNVVSKALSALE